MLKLIGILILYCLIISCNNDRGLTAPAENRDFFPVTSFLKGQVHEVDSLKLPFLEYRTLNNKTDTVAASPEEFYNLAAEFTEFDINDMSIKRYYTETSFADQSIPSITFNYSTKNRNLPLQRVDILINPDPVLSDKVKSIYMEKITTSRDTSIVKKLYWKTGKSLEVITSKKVPGSPAVFRRVKVIWAPAD